MKTFQGTITALSMAFIGILSVAFFSSAINDADEGTRITALWLGLFTLFLVIGLAIPYLHKAVTGKEN